MELTTTLQSLSSIVMSLSPAALVSIAVVSSAVLIALKRRYLSPVSDIPGPFFGSFSIFWKIWTILTAHLEDETIALHKKHGMQLLLDSVSSFCCLHWLWLTRALFICAQVTLFEFPTMKSASATPMG